MVKIQKIIIILGFSLLMGGCAFGPKEPQGKPVELTQEELKKVNYAYVEMRPWAAWHNKGTRLVRLGSYEEALYCFNQAIAVWPKKFTEVKGTYHLEPTDTILQKASLFLKMNEPQLAIKYYKKFQKYKPYNNFSAEGIKKAEAILKK